MFRNNGGKNVQPLPKKGLRVTIETADTEYLAAGVLSKYTIEGEGVIAFVKDAGTTHAANLGHTSVIDAISALMRKGQLTPTELLGALMLGMGASEHDAAEQESADEARAREGGAQP